jgi:5-methylcytosine-specific restriction enzyme subunit McrC
VALLFEYDKSIGIQNQNVLKQRLQDIWNRWKYDEFLENADDEKAEGISTGDQSFLKIDGGQIKANNYIGFIQHGEELIEIYPKVFRHIDNPSDEVNKRLMLKHIFYWFSYCRNWKFPFSQAFLDKIDIKSFPELILYIHLYSM